MTSRLVRARISPLFCQAVAHICRGDSEKVFIIFYNLCRRITNWSIFWLSIAAGVRGFCARVQEAGFYPERARYERMRLFFWLV